MTPAAFKQLLSGYRSGTLSAVECKQLQQLLHAPEYREQLEQLFSFDETEQDAELPGEENLAMIYEGIKLQAEIPEHQAAVKPVFPLRWAAAAVLFISISVGVYLMRGAADKVPPANGYTQYHKDDVLPGGNRAVLTLSDGSTIALDRAENGQIASEKGVKIKKSADGKLRYVLQGATGPVAYNTISTPKGGQYQVTLPDGTMVWLNAASSLKYPAVFKGKERRVELTGEAYFEVAKNKDMPFSVKTKKQEVSVLGTHFNINAYADEDAIRTTLLEGAVKVNGPGTGGVILKPGQQAVVNENIKVVPVDANAAIDWKSGVFWFNDENIQSIMRQFARWYNVDVEYRGDVGNVSFGGQISRAKNLSQVLRVMELTKSIRFEIEGRKIIVMRPGTSVKY